MEFSTNVLLRQGEFYSVHWQGMHTIREPKRVATSSISGHRFGWVCIAHQWLDLGHNDYLLVEGNEDVDLVESSASQPVHSEIQYKNSSGTFGSRNKVIYLSLEQFLKAWVSHRSSGRAFRGILWTTGRFKESKRSAIGAWVQGEVANMKQLQREVLQLLKTKTSISVELQEVISGQADFERFMSSVQCHTASCGLADELKRLKARLHEMVPDLAATTSVSVLLDAVVAAASAQKAEDRKLTRRSCWEILNDSTLHALSRAGNRGHMLETTSVCIRDQGMRACCLIVGTTSNFATLAKAASSWAQLTDGDLLIHIGNSVEFACYIAVGGSQSTAKGCRTATRRQVHFLYPSIVRAKGEGLKEARQVGREIAKRCIEFERQQCDVNLLAAVLSKIRWMRLSTGKVLTAKELLVPKD